MRSTRSRYYMKKRTRKRVFSILTLLFLLVQTILTPVAQYVSADSTTVGLSFNDSSVLEGDILTATLTDSGEDSGPLTFSVPSGLSIKEITEGQGNIDISNKGTQSLNFSWKEDSNQVVKVQVSADKADNYIPQLTSQNGGAQAAAIQVTTLEPEVTTEEATEETSEGTTEEEVVASEESTEDSAEASEEEQTATEDSDKESSEEQAAQQAEDQNKEEQEAENEKTEIAKQSEDGQTAISLEAESKSAATIAESKGSTTFNHIDIRSAGSVTYSLDDGTPITIKIKVTEEMAKAVKIYVGNTEADAMKKETPLNVSPVDNEHGFEWRYEGTFNKRQYYNIVFTFYLDADADGVEEEYIFEKVYQWTNTSANLCPDKSGLDIEISAAALGNIVTMGKIDLSKIVDGVSASDYKSFDFIVVNSESKIIGKSVNLDLSDQKEASELITSLPAGNYTVYEADPSGKYEGYDFIGVTASVNDKDTTVTKEVDGTYAGYYKVADITVAKGKTTKVTFTNKYKPLGSLKITKVDSTNKNVTLSGVKFELTKEEDKSFSVTMETDEKGTITFDKLEYGTYTLTEVATIDGYVLPENPVVLNNIKIDQPGQLVEKTIENTKENPSLSIEKTVNEKKEWTAEAGETVTYKIVVRNTGNTDLKDIVVTDVFEMEGDLTLTYVDGEETKTYKLGDKFDLAYGDHIEFTAKYQIPANYKAGVYDNTATAEVDGLDPVSSTATVTVAKDAGIAINKTVNDEKEITTEAGKTVTYKIVVRNTGNTDLKDVVLTDVFEMKGDLTLTYVDGEETKTYKLGDKFDLAYGDHIEFTAAYEIPANYKAGVYDNTATAEVDGLDPVSSKATVTVAEDEGLTIDKTVNGEKEITTEAGKTVTYKIVVRNTGNTDLKDVVLTDVFEMKGDLTLTYVDGEETKTYKLGDKFDLAYGDHIEFTAAYEIPANYK
ncbi:DUF11 domain-containing protein, partial [Bacillus sp. D12]